MSIEIKTSIRYEYVCEVCGHTYTEQRDAGVSPFYTTCNVSACNGAYKETNTIESTYEVIIPDPIEEVTE
jgi:ribosomal protein L37AE/L43A